MASFREIQTRDTEGLGDGPRPNGGVRWALRALVGAALVWGLTYLVPGLERYRPWSPAQRLPFLALFDSNESPLAVAEAAGGQTQMRGINSWEKSLLKAPPASAKPQDKAPPPARFGAPVARLESTIPESDYAGVKVQIEDPHASMTPFYKALQITAQKTPNALTRISHWGDSAVAPDQITAVVRIALQKRFGDGGHGFMLASKGTRWYAHAGVSHREENWKNLRITHRNAKDGRYGLGGIRSVGDSTSYTSYSPRKGRAIGSATARFQVYYLKGPRMGSFTLRMDRTAKQTIDTRSDTWQDAVHTVNTTDEHHRFRITGRRGKINMYGVVMERPGPGIVYDNLGLTGYFGQRMKNIDLEHFKKQLDFRRPDLMIAMFGGNTLGHPYWRPKNYEKRFTGMLKHFRAARPKAACLVISPLDHGEVYKGKKRSMPRVSEMVAIQRQVALRHKCAFFSLYDAMGGDGTMARWVKTRPRLAIHDMAHVTRDGARILGRLIYSALLKDFVGYLKRDK
jgi:lysophospholipase L1-like esterase